MSEIIKKCDENGNLIYYKNNIGYEYWQEFDKNNNCIHSKDSRGNEYFWKYKKEICYKCITISQKEFEQIKKEAELNKFLKENKLINRFSLIDI